MAPSTHWPWLAASACMSLLLGACLLGGAGDGASCRQQRDCQNACIFDGPNDDKGVCGPARRLGEPCSRPGWWRSDCAGNLECTEQGVCACPSGESCDPGVGGGVDGGTYPTTGVGAPCTHEEQCDRLPGLEPLCIEEWVDDQGRTWNRGGFCSAFDCLRGYEDPDIYEPGTVFQGAPCDAQDVCRIFAYDDGTAYGACFPGCQIDTDCRPGYICAHTLFDPMTGEPVPHCVNPH